MGILVRQRPKESGVWYLCVCHRGERYSKKVGKGKRAYKDAMKRAEDMRQELLRDDLYLNKVFQTEEKFQEYAEQWFKSNQGRRQSTVDDYHKAIRTWAYPTIGKKQLTDIERRHLKQIFRNMQNAGLTSIRAVKSPLNLILEEAVDDGIIQTNPLTGIRITNGQKKNDSNINERMPLSKEEVITFLEHALEYNDGQFYPYFHTAFSSGLRPGEMIALEWSDIDFENQLIKVSKTYRDRYGTVPPKNGKNRSVYVPESVMETLKELRSMIGPIDSKEATDETFLVFKYLNKRISRHTVQKALTAILKRAGIDKRLTPHYTRHTYSVVRLIAGDNPVDVSRQLGHSDPTITYKHYSKWLPSDDFKNQIDELNCFNVKKRKYNVNSKASNE